ncbi:MAG: Peptidyl-prolyl isomerase cwc27 [Trichoglossum hirsutum]|nr:MAG: Peptidyl-prolyl isomerase cwc27 [Trichoglossum hirsutum]
MATVYNLEPIPTAKVLLTTTSGDILLELFAKQTPLTSRNFLQHCLDGYYDDTIFHRLVPGFIIQGGDPTGTGEGGESIYNDRANNVFVDEFHSRLKFNRRGLLGMANGGQRDDNGSQFFLTLGKTEELNGRNTMFGRVVGDTIYNVVKMSEVELVEGTERPVYPTKVLGAEVLVNPFEDMVARKRRVVNGDEAGMKKEVGKRKAKRKGGKALLSFGGEEGEDGDGDRDGELVVKKKAKFNTKLVTAGSESTPEPRKKELTVNVSAAARTTTATKPTQSPRPPPSRLQQQKPPPPRQSPSRSPSPSPPPREQQPTLLSETLNSISALSASLKRNSPPPPKNPPKKASALAQLIPPTSTRARKRGAGGASAAEDHRALEALEAFRRKLQKAGARDDNDDATTPPPEAKHDSKENPAKKQANDDDNEEEHVCDLHFLSNCQSCTPYLLPSSTNNDPNDPNPHPPPSPPDDTAWLSHTLTFAKDRLGKNLDWKRKNEELSVEDPWEGGSSKRGAGRGVRAWDRRGGGMGGGV